MVTLPRAQTKRQPQREKHLLVADDDERLRPRVGEKPIEIATDRARPLQGRNDAPLPTGVRRLSKPMRLCRRLDRPRRKPRVIADIGVHQGQVAVDVGWRVHRRRHRHSSQEEDERAADEQQDVADDARHEGSEVWSEQPRG